LIRRTGSGHRPGDAGGHAEAGTDRSPSRVGAPPASRGPRLRAPVAGEPRAAGLGRPPPRAGCAL